MTASLMTQHPSALADQAVGLHAGLQGQMSIDALEIAAQTVFDDPATSEWFLAIVRELDDIRRQSETQEISADCAVITVQSVRKAAREAAASGTPSRFFDLEDSSIADRLLTAKSSPALASFHISAAADALCQKAWTYLSYCASSQSADRTALFIQLPKIEGSIASPYLELCARLKDQGCDDGN